MMRIGGSSLDRRDPADVRRLLDWGAVHHYRPADLAIPTLKNGWEGGLGG